MNTFCFKRAPCVKREREEFKLAYFFGIDQYYWFLRRDGMDVGNSHFSFCCVFDDDGMNIRVEILRESQLASFSFSRARVLLPKEVCTSQNSIFVTLLRKLTSMH